ncbi:MAG TPA: hypothetical protein VFU69_15565 [Ktedonobacterales bacterium]|nr:hypothetical protein [Ktedonobacterales bacterium]
MMNTPSGSFSPLEEIPQDTPVYDVNGEKVGNVVVSTMRDGYFVIEKGVIFTQELYIPAVAVLGRDAHSVRLRLSKDELKDERWKQPPSSIDVAAPTNVPPTAAQPDINQNLGQNANTIPQVQPPLTPEQGQAANMIPQEEPPPPTQR